MFVKETSILIQEKNGEMREIYPFQVKTAIFIIFSPFSLGLRWLMYACMGAHRHNKLFIVTDGVTLPFPT